MKILVDMNLPPRWTHFLKQHGHEATHWSAEGNIRASDAELLEWAREKGCVVLTHDLDFGLLLSIQGHSARVRVLPLRGSDRSDR